MKKDSEEKVSAIKNNENNEYSETAEIIDEKKSQILKHLISNHADDHVTEEFNHHDNEHKNRQEHVVYIVSIMFNKADDDDCLTSVIKK